ncbi:hypothetical protein ABEB36_014629 [Hypothenemus hampei]|uniref:DUF4371 domain-containing protein n=1 Tax=Hypothenemus hampei TaxID=57062 RepID=A0ABD1E2M2_HYPHA
MGKWSKYKKTHNIHWEKDPVFKADLLRHANTEKHKQRFSSTVNENQLKLTNVASYITAHTSLNSVDYLTNIINGPDHKKSSLAASSSSSCSSELDRITLRRTKCTSIIKEVIAPILLENLIEDLENSAFSLIVDESTDLN